RVERAESDTNGREIREFEKPGCECQTYCQKRLLETRLPADCRQFLHEVIGNRHPNRESATLGRVSKHDCAGLDVGSDEFESPSPRQWISDGIAKKLYRSLGSH